MERTMSVEDKIRRAEEIYNRRRENEYRTTTARVNVENTKKSSVLVKVRNQIIVCVVFYLIFYYLFNNNILVSEDMKNKLNEILSYEMNFSEIYSNICNYFNSFKNENKTEEPQTINNSEENVNNVDENNVKIENNNENKEKQENQADNSIGGSIVEENQIANTQKEMSEEEKMRIDADEIKKRISFITPVKGTITSPFGYRDSKINIVSKYHTGLDIGATTGTEILSATDGKVTLRSTKGDYGYHLKIEIDDIAIIYAHCSKLIANEGDVVTKGQKIAEVGSTGNSTGPHLHFEVRKNGKYINPQLILDI